MRSSWGLAGEVRVIVGKEQHSASSRNTRSGRQPPVSKQKVPENREPRREQISRS